MSISLDSLTCERQAGGRLDPRPSYQVQTVDAEGDLVRDDLTWLEWTNPTVAPTAFDPDDAAAFCQSLDFSGSDWRLPSLLELLSIADYGAQPVLSPPFRLGDQDFYWVAPMASDSLLNQRLGVISPPDAEEHGFRCVRGPPLKPEFEPVDGVYRETLTQLEWDVTLSPRHSWSESLTACPVGWRVPTIKELLITLDQGTTNPLANSMPVLWSSSAQAGNAGSAWWVMPGSSFYAQATASTESVVCVRSID